MPPAENLMPKWHGTRFEGHVLLNMAAVGAEGTSHMAPGVVMRRTLQALNCQMVSGN